MQWQNLMLLRQQIVQHCKNAFFHLTCITCTPNQDDSLAKVDDSEVRMTCTIYDRICLKIRYIDNRKLRYKIGQSFLSMSKKEFVAKKIMPSFSINYSNRQPVGRQGTCIYITYVHCSFFEKLRHFAIKRIKAIWR